MNKSEFLNDLKKYLTILEDREQEYILEEYGQHIDMKLSTGLSEEEAIRDFGSVEELAAQILEAYHVKPEYQTVKTEKKLPDMTGVTQEGKRLWGTVSHFFKGAAKAAGDLGRTCWKKTKAAALWVVHILGVPFIWLGKRLKGHEKHTKEDFMAEDGRIEVSESGYEKRGPKGVLHSFGSFLGRIFSALWYCFLWCVRWGWNCIMIMTAFFGGLCCLVLLFLFAMLLVWLVQGYPLAGVTLACFGGVLCTGAFTLLCTTFLILKKKKDRMVQEEERLEEVRNA